MDLQRAAPSPLPLPNCYWVLPGRLLAGEHPGAATADATRARLARLLDAGVNAFIDLTNSDEIAGYDEALPAGVDYWRHPIPDHGVPRDTAAMAETLARLRTTLDAGRTVYLHCRAGIGRTGTVVGCLLVEQGLAGDDALRELNRLWRESPRAETWPAVPETEAQAEFVRSWRPATPPVDPLLEPETLAAAGRLRARFAGALLGLAIGDAAAAATQYARPGRFVPVGDLLGGGPFDLPRGAWSDDTAMALCLAESLLECNGFDERDQMERYRRWQRDGHLSATGECVGISAGTARALAISQWRRQAFSGSHDPLAQDPEVLARATPTAMFWLTNAEAAAHYAAEAARTTCQAPRVLLACRAFALALSAALRGGPKAAVLAAARAVLGEAGDLGDEVAAASTAATALAAALEAFERTDSFRDAVLGAANLGGNSDVVAAAAGALAGAHYTQSAIPTLWRNSLMKKELLEEFADRLLTHALLELAV